MSKPPPTGRLGTASGRRPGTASRLASAKPPGTASQRTGGGVALTTQLNVQDRVTTQQGLGGLKTGQRGPSRVVQDRTYWIATLKNKMQEIHTETNRLHNDTERATDDQSQYVMYEKKAEHLASELQKLQDEMADYNTLMDKLATDSDKQDVLADIENIKESNIKESKAVEVLFEKKTQLEKDLDEVQKDIAQERMLSDNLVMEMNQKMRQEYDKMKQENEHYLSEIEKHQDQLDRLEVDKQQLEQELYSSPAKMEAVRILQELKAIERKRDAAKLEERQRGTPEQQRDQLLNELKKHNQEIASMERQGTEMQERMVKVRAEIQQLDMELEQGSSEKQAQYKELKKREATMDEFLRNFEQTKREEEQKLSQLEENVVQILQETANGLSSLTMPLPGKEKFEQMKADLDVKKNELQKSEATTAGILTEREQLQRDLEKIERLESKVSNELRELKAKEATMQLEIQEFQDLATLNKNADAKKNSLKTQSLALKKRLDTMTKFVGELRNISAANQSELDSSELQQHFQQLETKWQRLESSAFALSDQIAAKAAKTDFTIVASRVQGIVSTYNEQLQQSL